MAITTKDSSKPQPLSSLIEKVNIYCKKEKGKYPERRLNLGARVIKGLQSRSLLENIEILKYCNTSPDTSVVQVEHRTAKLFVKRFCMKYLNTLNKVQIDQKADVGMPTVSAYCLKTTVIFSLC